MRFVFSAHLGVSLVAVKTARETQSVPARILRAGLSFTCVHCCASASRKKSAHIGADLKFKLTCFL